MTVKIDVETKTLVRMLAVVSVFIVGAMALRMATQAIYIVFISIFLALALNPPVSWLAKKTPSKSRLFGTGVAYLLVISLLVGFLYITIPPLARQSVGFIDEIPQFIDTLKEQEGVVGDFIEQYNLEEEAREFVANATSQLGDSSGALITGIGRVSNSIFTLLTVFVLTFLMLIEGPRWLDKFWELHKEENREHHKQLALKMYNVVTGYVNGQLLIALLAAVSATVIMLILGIPYAIPLGGLVGIFALIPLVGATIGAIVVTLVALFQSVTAAIIMGIFFVIYQQIENNVVQPYVQSKTLDMSPLLVFLAVVVGITTGGLVGGFIAIPVAGIGRVLVIDYLEKRKEREQEEKKRAKKLLAAKKKKPVRAKRAKATV